MKRTPIDPELLRDRLAAAQGKQYWRCLEELSDDPQFREMLQREFAADASVWEDPLSRRRFLTLMGASLALGGLAGCRPPTGTILPYVRQPENLVLGKPLFYATAMPLSGFAIGLLVESHEGRPTKIEGNPDHPASRGATTVQNQAAILGMYDPDRSQTVQFRGQTRAWPGVVEVMRQRLSKVFVETEESKKVRATRRQLRPQFEQKDRQRGAGVAFLSEAIGSPTLLWQKDRLLSAYSEARWFTYEPVNRDNVVSGAQLAFGRPYHCYYNLEKADVIVALDADFLGVGPAQLAYTRQFADRRRLQEVTLAGGKTEFKPGGKSGMNRLYVAESELSVTGANADHRFAVKPSEIEDFARKLAAKLGVPGLKPVTDAGREINAIAEDLKARASGSTLVIAGDGQPPVVHAIVHAINQHLGNFGKTVLFTEPIPQTLSSSSESLQKLKAAIQDGEIDTLIILGGNPAYTAPGIIGVGEVPLEDLLARKLADPIEKWLAIHVGMHFNETARLCHWHIPQTHFLEEWSDTVAFDGTAAIVQPLIAPLYAGRSFHEVLAAVTPSGEEDGSYDSRPPFELVRAYWRSNRPASDNSFEAFWQKALHQGVIPDSAWPTIIPPLSEGLFDQPQMRPTRYDTDKGYELIIAPDPAVYDGRFANNAWLQEWPKPLNRLSWGNAVTMSSETARKLRVNVRVGNWQGGQHGDSIADIVQLRVGRSSLEAPVWIVPGHADDVLTLHIGYGHSHGGKIGKGVGVNANKIRRSGGAWFVTGVEGNKRPGEVHLACQQAHHSMEGRDLVRSGTLADYEKDPRFATKHDHSPPGASTNGEKKHPLPSLYPNTFEYPGYKWGMAIDLSACTGCGACVVACQAENNIPVVGKEEVLRGREMHWLRIDRYYATPRNAEREEQLLEVHFQPVLCQHCETAPCELVCPVEATVHSADGLNDMVYNRCVGTRYCSNNCPYKVRRFNFLQYSEYAETPSLRLMYNPDVTVRTRGVMEKCTFCVQRIAYARIEAAKEAVDELSLPPAKRVRRDPQGRTEQGREVAYIRDGEVVTACQAACPAQAIIFGDLNDPKSNAHKLHKSALSYALLGELGTLPRVAYLAGLRNPNPKLELEKK